MKMPIPVTEDCSENISLIRKCQQGDILAFDTLMKLHYRQVAALADRLLGWPGEVDDILQDIFLSTWQGIGKFKGKCSFKTWLFQITINHCRSWKYRKLLKKRLHEKLRLMHDSTNTANDCLLIEEQNSRIRLTVSCLPVKYREAVVLIYLQQLESNEVCEILKISKNALHVRLSRAREMLKEKLSDLMEE